MPNMVEGLTFRQAVRRTDFISKNFIVVAGIYCFTLQVLKERNSSVILNGKTIPVLGIPTLSSLDHKIEQAGGKDTLDYTVKNRILPLFA